MGSGASNGVSEQDNTVIVKADDYLNKLTGERIERECKVRLEEGYRKLVVDLSQTELVNSIGVSILLGIIDSAKNAGAEVTLSGVNHDTVELFEMLGVNRHAEVLTAKESKN